MRRIHEQPVEKTIWEPISVPMTRSMAFEQMAKAVKGRKRFRFTLGREVLAPTDSEVGKPSTQVLGGVSDALALD